MSHPRQFQMVGGSNNNPPPGHYNDTTFTKIFVGGLAWETQRDTMRRYFEQFGEILEAVVITDKNTGRSKGYSFVTFKDPEAAMRACQNPSPVIDGRRANCNLASLGANKNNRPPTPHQHGTGRFRPGPGLVAATPSYHGSSSSASAFFHQHPGQYTFPYSTYGYPGYSQDTMYPMNYYSVYGGGQHFSPYYPSSGASSGPPAGGLVHNIYPLYAQYAQTSSQAQGFGLQYPQMLQFPFLPHQQHYASSGILSFPSSMTISTTPTNAVATTATTTTATAATATTTTSTTVAAAAAAAATSGAGGSSQASGTASEQKSST